jgi:hypothetical protein
MFEREIGRMFVSAMLLVGLVFAAGCENAGQGAVSGGAVGALSGLAIGSLTGSAGAGAAIGAVTGAVGGAVIGDQNRRNKEATEQAAAAAAVAPPYSASGPLWKLVGDWKVDGQEVSADGTKINASGTAKAAVDKNFFLRIDLNMNDASGNTKAQGTSLIAQEGGDRIRMYNSFSTTPQLVQYGGQVERGGTVFSLKQTQPAGTRKINIRITDPDRWTAEVWERRSGQDVQVETMTFTRAG